MIDQLRKLMASLLLFIFFSGFAQAQERSINERSISKKFDLNGLSPAQVISKAEHWISSQTNQNEEFAKVVSVENKELSLKGESKVLYRNIGKELYPKRNAMAEVLDAYFEHEIDIKIEEDHYIITYTVTDMKKELYGKEDVFFNCVNFTEIQEEDLNEYNHDMDRFLKANLVFKKRREIFMNNSKSQFEEVSNFLLNEGEMNIFFINEAITES